MNPRTQRLLEAQAETARTINRLMLTLLGLGLASTLTVGFPDSYLLTTATTVSIPFAGAASFKALFILGPVLLICVRAYLEIYVTHWRRLDGLLRRSPSARVRRLPIVSPFRHPLLRLFSGFILYPLVPLVLGIFTYEAMVFRQWGVGLLYLTLASTLVLVCLRFSWAWPYRFIAPPLALLTIIVTAEHEGGLDGFRRPFKLQLANLERSILSYEDLRSADLRGAKLNEANLTRAQLEGADLSGAQLEGANLSGAQLKGADLTRTNFEGATGLTPKSVEKACYRPKTGNKGGDRFRGPPINLPDGITIPPCKRAKEKN